ncbi:DNA polymerase III subunit delta [Oceanidesulfovibrio indonesiensis]|uniref:DNA polymerase III subunit delta n=1 Tax=Oceanidesulfovibrio indonesiensis TaxID=54767 RepID=A0A7M3MB82_9BACT|nr:DNA polymerase III subunit delta [Oceanidesulfovibrio indonesiensis]TVM15365.1 DNA polymerase III subunit delta [Oceanidesulfovibrio indonesiensis]
MSAPPSASGNASTPGADRPGFYFLACPDSKIVQGKVQELMKQYAPAASPVSLLGGSETVSGGGFDRRVYWAEEGLTPQFWEDLSLQSLTGTAKCIVLRHAEKLLAADWKALAPALAGFKEHAFPIFCLESAWQRNQPKPPAPLTRQKFWQLAQDRGWYWQSPGITRDKMTAVLQREAKRRSVSIAPDALRFLAESLPLDAAAITAEMDKLAVAALASGESDTGVVDAALAKETAYAPDIDIFGFIQALQKGTASVTVWRQVFADRLSGEGMLFPLLSLLAREARILWQIDAGETQAVRLPPSVMRAKEGLARQLGRTRIAALFDLALEAEYGVKSGERTPEQALERLVAGMAALFANDNASGQSGTPRPHPAPRRGAPGRTS